MDIQYLLYLQENVRNEYLTPFFMEVSNIAISFWLMSVFLCIFWCFNKKAGLFILASYSYSSIVNALTKLTFCVYRPWIRDPNIIPAGNAIKSAGGYSFPSGHTQIVTSYFVSSAVLTWFKHKWFSILFVIAIILVAFSRNYLGVHTPQDVIVGFILGSLCVFGAYKFVNRTKQDKETDRKLLICSIIIGIISILYFLFKSYPIDLDAKGNLIVDPQRMMRDGFLGVGVWLGFNLGWYIEKHYVDFSTDCSLKIKIVRAIIGIITVYLIYSKLGSWYYNNMPVFWARLSQWFSMMFYSLAIYPMIFKYAEKTFLTNSQQASRIILCLRDASWNEKDINDFILYVETGNEKYKPKLIKENKQNN